MRPTNSESAFAIIAERMLTTVSVPPKRSMPPSPSRSAWRRGRHGMSIHSATVMVSDPTT
jgi:hypothetical protein